MAYEILKPHSTATIRGVLFDMDGLVLDTEKLYSHFWIEACHFYGFPMTYEQSLGMRALNMQAGEAKMHSYFGTGADYLAIRAKRVELMEIFIDENGVDLKPGIVELLDYLDSQGIPTAITSSSPIFRIRKFLAPYGLDTLFAALMAVLVIYMHRANIKRLLNGTESRFGQKKKAESPKED